MFGFGRSDQVHTCQEPNQSYLTCKACIREENEGRCLDGSSYYNNKVLVCRCKGYGEANYCTACKKRAKFEKDKNAKLAADDARIDREFVTKAKDKYEQEAFDNGWRSSMECMKYRGDYLCGKINPRCPKCLRLVAEAKKFTIWSYDENEVYSVTVIPVSAVRKDGGGDGYMLNPDSGRVYGPTDWWPTKEGALQNVRAEFEEKIAKLKLRKQDFLAGGPQPAPQEPPVVVKATAQPAPKLCKHYKPNSWLRPCGKLSVATKNCGGLVSKCNHWEG